MPLGFFQDHESLGRGDPVEIIDLYERQLSFVLDHFQLLKNLLPW